MKKISLSVAVILLMVTTLWAQSNEVTNSYFYRKDGLLDKAKVSADRAIRHEKTKNKAKTWYLRGAIYDDIANTKNPAYQNLAGDSAIPVAYNCYKMVEKLEPNGEFTKDAKARYDALWAMAINKGYEFNQAENNKKAIEYYMLAASIKPTDSTAYQYAALVAEKASDYDTFYQMLQKLKSLGLKTLEYYYKVLIREYLITNSDAQKALPILDEARLMYPGDKDIMIAELSAYQALGKTDVLKDKLKSAIAADPKNPALYLATAQLYDEEYKNEKDPAKKDELKKVTLDYYAKTVELNPKSFDAHFNTGVIFYNEAVEINKELNSLNVKDYNLKGKKIEDKERAKWAEALVHFEKAYEVNSKDMQLLNALLKCYTKVKRTNDAERIDKEIQQL